MFIISSIFILHILVECLCVFHSHEQGFTIVGTEQEPDLLVKVINSCVAAQTIIFMINIAYGYAKPVDKTVLDVASSR